MALVMLPCDMPWWPTLHKYLTQLKNVNCSQDLIPCMQKIINLCNISLDDDESPNDSATIQLGKCFDEWMTEAERVDFFKFTLPVLVQRALDLKQLRPPLGLRFSLQQQSDRVELERDFVASLLAHSFFSSFPKRTVKTHPTLLDFNFSCCFPFLNSSLQRLKLKSFIHYFNLLGSLKPTEKVVISRQVLTAAEWLTMDDWVSCRLPLCPLYIKRQGSLLDASGDLMRVCSSSPHIGASTLTDKLSMENKQMIICPESLAILLFVEALEDNEAFIIEGLLQVANFQSANTSLVLSENPPLVSLCCIDAEDYRVELESDMYEQYQEDGVLRELNKALTGFRQGRPVSRLTMLPRRLSPIGESFSSTPEKSNLLSTPSTQSICRREFETKRKFIVLGSSGECLPINRSTSCPSPKGSVSPEFFSARSSFTDTDDEVSCRRSLKEMKEERSSLFAQRLREALDRAEKADCSMSDYRWGREGSCGFVLEDDPAEDNERKYLAASSKYSFSTDYDSDIDGLCDEMGRWLEEEDIVSLKALGGSLNEGREEAVMELAGALLKRTLSDTWAGVSLPCDGGTTTSRPHPTSTPRSFSLELARNRLAAHLVCRVLSSMKDPDSGTSEGVKPVATLNWGCGERSGEPQLKMLLQWMAASVALIPHIVYYSAANSSLNMVDTVCRVVIDRQWSVGDLAAVIVGYAASSTSKRQAPTLFEAIISQEDRKHFNFRL